MSEKGLKENEKIDILIDKFHESLIKIEKDWARDINQVIEESNVTFQFDFTVNNLHLESPHFKEMVRNAIERKGEPMKRKFNAYEILIIVIGILLLGGMIVGLFV